MLKSILFSSVFLSSLSQELTPPHFVLQEADRLLQQEVFPTEYARYDYFKKVAKMYSDAADEAEQSGDYERGAELRCKEAQVYAEKLHEISLAIYSLRQAFSSYRNQNLETVRILSDQIIYLFDCEYQQLSEELAENEEDEDNDFVYSGMAHNRIGKAAFYEELARDPQEWQDLYKEAANILLQQDDSLFDRDAGLTNQAVAAMCLEKIPQEQEAAKSIYRDELTSWQQHFTEYQEEQLDNENEESALYSIIDMCIWTKTGKFLAIKANDQAAYLKIAEFELANLEQYIYRNNSNLNVSDRYELFPICLYVIACAHLGMSDHRQIEKLRRLTNFLDLDENLERSSQFLELFEDNEIMEIIDLFDHIAFARNCSVEASVEILSKLHL